MKFKHSARTPADQPAANPAPPQGLDLRAGMPSRDDRKAKSDAVWAKVAERQGWTYGRAK